MILFLDTNVVIYAVENPVGHGPKANARLTAARTAGDVFMISDLVRTEVLVGPLKQGNATLEQEYRLFFAATDVTVVGITAAVCERAARIRATYNFEADGRPPARRRGRARRQRLPDRRRPTQLLRRPDGRGPRLTQPLLIPSGPAATIPGV